MSLKTKGCHDATFIIIGGIAGCHFDNQQCCQWRQSGIISHGFQSKSSTQLLHTVYPKKYAHGLCFAVLCCGYTLTDIPISIRLTSLALWQYNDCPNASKATLMNMDKYFMWIHYERLHNHNKAKHNKTVCIFLGIYCTIIIHNHKLYLHCSIKDLTLTSKAFETFFTKYN